MTINIASMSDWKTLSSDGLDVVIDPLVIRCGEIFLNGKVHAKNADQSWLLLNRNVHALGLFFDVLILEDRIPIFNYGDTFDMRLNFDDRVFNTINDIEHVLYDVNVDYQPYIEVKAAALVELEKLYSGPQKIKYELARDILDEKDAAEYHWAPSLGHLEQNLPSEFEKDLARFFLGGLIFGAYAHLIGGSHILQPKRSRLFLAASLNKPASFKFEEVLFGELKQLARSLVTELPWKPTFFPYLLSISNSPEELLTQAMKLRKSSQVRDYRAWLAAAFAQWERDGHLGPVHREIKKIAKAIEHRIAGDGALPKVEIKVDVADVALLASGKPMLPGKIDFTPTLSALWGWTYERLPGHRYRKLLTRAIASDHAYLQIQNRINSVWSAAG